MPDLTYTAITLTDHQVEKAARAVVEQDGGDWNLAFSWERDEAIEDAQVAIEAVLPEILNAHTAMMRTRLAKAMAVHEQWQNVHHDSDAHQLLAELHQALFGGEQ